MLSNLHNKRGQVWILWHGGSSYAPGSIPEDLERFPSRAAAIREVSRRASGMDSYYPCVEDSSAQGFYRDPTGERDPYPDFIIEQGPHGGWRAVPC